MIPTKPLSPDGIEFVDEYNRTAVCPVGNLFLGKFECISDELGTIPNEHLDKLGIGELKKDSFGLVGARPSQQRLARTGWAVEESLLVPTRSLGFNSLVSTRPGTGR
jgi:hypothetical protein